MHGLIFLQLQRFAQQQGGAGAWERLLRDANLPKKSYSPVRDYPDAELLALVGAACAIWNLSAAAVVEAFGEFLAPELLRLYDRLIKPGWKTLDLVENTEAIIHAAVRVGNPGARPPVLVCFRTTEDELQIVYSSNRQLCSLAKGILKGLAKHFAEAITVTEEACMLRGDPYCALQVCRVSAQGAVTGAPVGTVTGLPDSTPSAGSGGPGPLVVDESFSVGEPGDQGAEAVAITTQIRAEGTSDSDPAVNQESFVFLRPAQQGDEIGRLQHFRVLQLIGQGGMGIVFRAEDTRLGRHVALKVMRPEWGSDAIMRQRFLREARAMAAIKSDHVVTVYEAGVADEAPFLAMEFLEGETLEVHREKVGCLPLPETLRIGRETALGLAAAHARSLIHRDIKPGNLWLEAPTGRVKILDFGLAKAASAAALPSRPGLIMGTPAFMAPEQARGEAADHRTDLFSLGSVLYWLCTDQRPFQGKDVLSTLTALATHDPQPPQAIVAAIPPPLSDLIMQLLQKEPARRPSSSQFVAEALAAIERNYPTASPSIADALPAQ